MPIHDTHQDLIQQLFFASPKAIQLLHGFRDQVRRYDDELGATLVSLTIDEDCFSKLEGIRQTLFGVTNPSEFFPAKQFSAIAKSFEQHPEPGNAVLADATKALRFQLNLILLRICQDFLAGLNLYEAYSGAFNRQHPRICVRSDFTGGINWTTATEVMKSLLLSEFGTRFEEYRAQGEHYYLSRLHNEALTISLLVCTADSHDSQAAGAPVSGIEFERECADALELLGFAVGLTRASGDFGVDILARRTGVSFAIQCKRHTQPAGVGAVQEVSAGRKHYGTDYAAVISDSGFTTAARELAATTRVVLASPRDLEHLEILARNLDEGVA